MKKIIKGFTQFVNENFYYGEKDSDATLFDSYEEADKITAAALGCSLEELDNYFIGSPVTREGEPNMMDDFAPVIDLFNTEIDPEEPQWSVRNTRNSDWRLKKHGQIIWTVNQAGPGGYAQAHLFNHNGMTVVVIDGDDGPFVYIKPSVNEGDNPAHNFLRKTHKHKTGEEPNPKYNGEELEREFGAMSDTDKDRFEKVADRTRNFRKADVSRAKESVIAAFYRNNPNRLLLILDDAYFTRGSEVATDIVDKFVNDPSMTLTQLAQEVSSSDTHRETSPESVIRLLTMYANNPRIGIS